MPSKAIYDALIQRGLPPHIARGILGNIYVESGFDPGINEVNPVVPGSRGGFGLFQHTGPRRVALEGFAREKGVPVDDINTQIDFMMRELGTTERKAGEALKGATTIEEAARIFSEQFLRPGVPHLDRRIAAATGDFSRSGPAVSTQGAQQRGTDFVPQQQQRTGLAGLLGGNSGPLQEGGILSPDRRDRLILALQGMSMNPNVALQQAALQGLKERAGQRTAAAQANKTAEFLRQRGRDDLASAVESGAIPAQIAVQEALKAPAQVKGVEINGRLVNPVTGALIADFSDDDGDLPAGFQSLKLRAEAAGLKEGTPEYQQFMINQGRSEGIALSVSPDGTVSLAQGGAQLPKLPKGAETLDKETAKDLSAFIQGGAADSAKNIAQLRQVREEIASGSAGNVSGPLIGSLPRGVLAAINPSAIDVRERVEEVVQRNLREVLGAQFTEREGERLIARAYNPQLPEEQNLARLDRLIKQMELARATKVDAANYFREHGTLSGWKGKLPTISDFSFGDDAPASGDAATTPRGGATHRFNPQTGQVELIK